MRKWIGKWLERIGVISGAWAILRAIYAVIGHYGNFQTLWSLVKDWPTYLRYATLIVGSVWLPLALAFLCLIGWLVLKVKEQQKEKKKSKALQELAPVQITNEPAAQPDPQSFASDWSRMIRRISSDVE